MVNAGPCVELLRRRIVCRGIAGYWRLQMDNGTGVKRLTGSAVSRGFNLGRPLNLHALRGAPQPYAWTNGRYCRSGRDKARLVVDRGLKFKRYSCAANEDSTLRRSCAQAMSLEALNRGIKIFSLRAVIESNGSVKRGAPAG